jgi:2-polyprenyl-6-methoxyphenol hydroxylase-like FAD-dependent oxidoreductase
LVIGGGIAGSVAARVLADHFASVVVIERDRVPDLPAPRRGAPHARHVHVLLHRGAQALEALFPGLAAELGAAGANRLDSAADLAWLTPAGWALRFPSEVPILSCSRDLLEWSLRRRLAAFPNVSWRDGIDVIGFVPDAGNRRVTGVSIRKRHGDSASADAGSLSADLVVDASGRTSRTPEWLAALGHAAPAETVVDVGLA